MDRTLFILQRLTAMLLGLFVLVHLGGILYAMRGGLSAAEILGRTRGNWGFILFYLAFALCACVHAPIGLRHILIEWGGVGRRSSSAFCLAFGLVLLTLGVRAVIAVSGVAS